jgi:hypothetical protein
VKPPFSRRTAWRSRAPRAELQNARNLPRMIAPQTAALQGLIAARTSRLIAADSYHHGSRSRCLSSVGCGYHCRLRKSPNPKEAGSVRNGLSPLRAPRDRLGIDAGMRRSAPAAEEDRRGGLLRFALQRQQHALTRLESGVGAGSIGLHESGHRDGSRTGEWQRHRSAVPRRQRRAQFVIVMKGEDDVRPIRTRERAVRA